MKQKKKSKSFDQRINKQTSLLFSVAFVPKPCQGFFSSILFHEFALLSLLSNGPVHKRALKGMDACIERSAKTSSFSIGYFSSWF